VMGESHAATEAVIRTFGKGIWLARGRPII
jgi:hypothetical protein